MFRSPADCLPPRLDITSNPDTHSECTILHELHGLPSIPYIGVSKLSCAFCGYYIRAYNEEAGKNIKTLGSYGHNTYWRFPIIPPKPDRSDEDDLNTRIRDNFCLQLHPLIVHGWLELNTVRRGSQSTDTSFVQRTKDTKHGKYFNNLTQCAYLYSLILTSCCHIVEQGITFVQKMLARG